MGTLNTPSPLPLANASRRLRRPPGRPRRALTGAPTPGCSIQGATSAPAPDAGIGGVFAGTLPPRGLSVEAGARYLGVSKREFYRFIERRLVRPIRLPQCRRVLVDRIQLDALLTAHQEPI